MSTTAKFWNSGTCQGPLSESEKKNPGFTRRAEAEISHYKVECIQVQNLSLPFSFSFSSTLSQIFPNPHGQGEFQTFSTFFGE